MSDKGQWVEVQIRTKRMDDIAEKGYAAHWKYKDSYSNPEQTRLEQWIARVRDMLESNDTSAIEFVDDFRSNLFSDEVFVFTPKGELKTLPNGATALDFAFDIHTEVGAKCIGAKVNQRLVPINHELKNGDQVEILTSNKQKPNEDWLRFTVSSKAKSKIKDVLKEEKKSAALEGKEIVYRKLKQMKIEPKDEVINRIRAYFNEKTPLDLYYGIGTGKHDPKNIKKFQDEVLEPKPKSGKRIRQASDAKTFEKELKQAKGQDMLLIGEDMDVVDYTIAKCCNPIPGDDVFGFVTVNEGIKIHRTSCPNAPELLSNHGNRVVKARWTSQQEIAFLAGLQIIGTDRVALISDVTQIISDELKVNMQSISVDTQDGIFEGKIHLFVQSTKHLDDLIAKLRAVNGIVKVNRYD
jgi:GTP pyrophosphokinase